MEQNELVLIFKAFYNGIKEYGVEKAVSMLNENIDKDDPDCLKIYVTALHGLFALFSPEIIENEKFVEVLDSAVKKVSKEEVEERINIALEQLS